MRRTVLFPILAVLVAVGAFGVTQTLAKDKAKPAKTKTATVQGTLIDTKCFSMDVANYTNGRPRRYRYL